jgi:hypothetical protein
MGSVMHHLARRATHSLRHDALVIEQHIREGRFQRRLALLAGLSTTFAGLEVLLEHYRGSYGQRIMYSPIILMPALLVAGVWAAFSRRVARTVLPLVSLVTILDGVAGFVFHIRGVARKPGGWRIPVCNVIMGPPIFAPLLLGLSGFLGIIAAFLRREGDPVHLVRPVHTLRRPARSAWLAFAPHWLVRDALAVEQDIREGRFQRGLAVATALLALFNGVESLYSHYKNNFTYRVEWLPIIMTPIVMLAGFGTLWSRVIARTLLPISSAVAGLVGMAGFAYHVRGVLRRPDGLRSPLYNLVYGPPVFAPLLFGATGLLGLLASLLRRER